MYTAKMNKTHNPSALAGVFSNERISFMRSLFTALRPHQWIKNLLVFVPLLAAHSWRNPTSIIHSIIAFIVFCLMASSVYLLNDLIDLADDKHHHRKRNRPFAAGHINRLWGWVLWPILLVIAFTIAKIALSLTFMLVMSIYFLLTMAYSLRLKQYAIIDVLILACLYLLRIVAGGVTIHVLLSFWLLAFSLFFFLSLAFIKRFSELKLARDAGNDEKIRGRGYVHHDLELVSIMGVVAGYIAILVLALYIQDTHTAELYSAPQFIWLACPVLLYWISRIWLIAHRGNMHDDPIIFAMKDKISWLVVVFCLGIFGIATVVG